MKVLFNKIHLEILHLGKKIERRRNAVLTKTQCVFMILVLLYADFCKLSTCLQVSFRQLLVALVCSVLRPAWYLSQDTGANMYQVLSLQIHAPIVPKSLKCQIPYLSAYLRGKEKYQ